MEFAQKHKKPVLHIDIGEYPRKETIHWILRWFKGDVAKPTPPRNCVLNVAGQRESKAKGIQKKNNDYYGGRFDCNEPRV